MSFHLGDYRLAFPVCKQSLALVPGQKYTPKTQKKKNRKTNWS